MTLLGPGQWSWGLAISLVNMMADSEWIFLSSLSPAAPPPIPIFQSCHMALSKTQLSGRQCFALLNHWSPCLPKLRFQAQCPIPHDTYPNLRSDL